MLQSMGYAGRPNHRGVQCSVFLCMVGGFGSMGRDGVLGVGGSQDLYGFEAPSPRDLVSAHLHWFEPYWVLSTSYVTTAGIPRNPWSPSPKCLPKILPSFIYCPHMRAGPPLPWSWSWPLTPRPAAPAHWREAACGALRSAPPGRQ